MFTLESSGTPIDYDKELVENDDLIDEKERERLKSRDGIMVSFLNRKSYVMSNLQALLSPSLIPGFSLVEKVWARFLIDKVKPIIWAENTFEKLEIDQISKRVIRSLVMRHQASKDSFDDLIAGKGKGLVFLLFGPPGSGKTLTAGKKTHSSEPNFYSALCRRDNC
jgi:signal recognition particle GTPase